MNTYFLCLVASVLVLGYFLAVSKTINLYVENQTLENSFSNLNQKEKQLQILSSQKAKIDSILVDMERGDKQFLLKQMSKVNIRGNQLARYAEVNRRSDNQAFSVFRYEGDFKSLASLLYEVEKRKYGGSIASAKFEVETERRTKVSRLFLELYFKK